MLIDRPTSAERPIEFEKMPDGFNYVLETTVEPGKEIYIKIPVVSANKRGVNDICWQTDGVNVTLYATISSKPHKTVLWSELKENYLVNKTVSALKFINNDEEACSLCIRVILN